MLNAISRSAIVLVGARRTGKNTLAKKVAQFIESVSLDLENTRNPIYLMVESIA